MVQLRQIYHLIENWGYVFCFYETFDCRLQEKCSVLILRGNQIEFLYFILGFSFSCEMSEYLSHMVLHAVFVLLDGPFSVYDFCMFSCRLNVKAFISNVKTALAATNPVSKRILLILRSQLCLIRSQ